METAVPKTPIPMEIFEGAGAYGAPPPAHRPGGGKGISKREVGKSRTNGDCDSGSKTTQFFRGPGIDFYVIRSPDGDKGEDCEDEDYCECEDVFPREDGGGSSLPALL